MSRLHRPRWSAYRPMLAFACALPLSARPAVAGDWPQWRGPDRDNVSKETGWSSDGRIAWRASIGTGYSTPVVAGGRVFATGYFEDESTPGAGLDRVSCLDAATGEPIWTREYPALAYANEHRGGALSTPTVCEGVLFVPTRNGEVRAFAVDDGELQWEVDLVERHAVEPGRYGFASSPFVIGADIVLNAGRALRLDRETGDTIWISEDCDANYSTVAPILVGERERLCVFGGKGLALIDAETGEQVAIHPFRQTPRGVEGATPIVLGTRVFVSTAYDQGGALIDFGGEAPVELWRTRRMRNKMAGCTLYEGHLYGFDESMLKCIDLGGEERWRERGLGQGALMVAGGRLLLTSSAGELIVADATPEAYVERSRQRVIEGGVFWATPVLANGRVLVRGSFGELVCLDHRAPAVADTAPTLEAPEQDAALPSPTTLAVRHIAALGFGAEPPAGLTFNGHLSIDALGFADSPARWSIGKGDRWHVRFDLPPGIGGAIERCFDGTYAWESNPYRGDKLLEARALKELRRTDGFSELLMPLPADKPARTIGVESFRGRSCHRVDLELAPGELRSLFFDCATGLLAGRTSAEEATVVLDDWRRVDGHLLPFARTVFDSDSGEEQRWRFESVAFDALDAAEFAVPESLAAAVEELKRAEQAGG